LFPFSEKPSKIVGLPFFSLSTLRLFDTLTASAKPYSVCWCF